MFFFLQYKGDFFGASEYDLTGWFELGFREFISFLKCMCCPANYRGSCYNFRQVLNDALFSNYTSVQVFYNGNQCNDHDLCGGGD